MMLGAAAAGAGAAASLTGGAAEAEAAPGRAVPVLLGKANKATAATSVSNSNGDGLTGRTAAGKHSGVTGTDTSPGGGYGLKGTSAHGTGVYGHTTRSDRSAVRGDDTGPGGFGVTGTSENSYGVLGSSVSGTGIYGLTSGNNNDGVTGVDISPRGGHGVSGLSDHGIGVYGQTSGNFGFGIFGIDNSSLGSDAVFGQSDHGIGVHGRSAGHAAAGVKGEDTSPVGSIGVAGFSDKGTGVVAAGNPGLLVQVDANVLGTLTKGGGAFKIDHPLDPAGKYLYHSFVESPDMKNIYDGTVILDGAGQARVQLPDWFETLNRDCRYQLTAIGAPAPGLHIAAKVSNGAFTIAGGGAQQEVCWQVTGIRHDPWANAHRIPVEAAKPAADQGRYLHPELYGDGPPVTAVAHAERLRRTSTTRPPMPRPYHPLPAGLRHV